MVHEQPPEESPVWPSSDVSLSYRDSTVEDEIFHIGYFADVAFKFHRAGTQDVEEVYGQSALFALLSPPLRRLLKESSEQPRVINGVARREIWLDAFATVQGFREVARYVYKLPQRFTTAVLPEAIYAAHRLQVSELEAAALDWGIAELISRRHDEDRPEDHGRYHCEASPSQSSDGNRRLGDSLRCLDQLCALEPRTPSLGAARSWREALLGTHSAEEIIANQAFLELSPESFRELLEGEGMHTDPGRLWLASVSWARSRAATEKLPQLPGGGEATLSRPVRLLGRGARLAVPAPPAKEEAVEWQRCLIPAAELIRFARMQPADFAKHVEALDPMLVDLRQVIYASRRRNLREEESTRCGDV